MNNDDLVERTDTGSPILVLYQVSTSGRVLEQTRYRRQRGLDLVDNHTRTGRTNDVCNHSRCTMTCTSTLSGIHKRASVGMHGYRGAASVMLLNRAGIVPVLQYYILLQY